MLRLILNGLLTLGLMSLVPPTPTEALDVARQRQTPCAATEPHLAGSFIQPWLADGWSGAQLAREMAVLRRACIDTVILQWTADSGMKSATFATGMRGWRKTSATDIPDRLLSAAAAAGVQVYVGLQVNDRWWSKRARDPRWLRHEAVVANRLAGRLAADYGAYDSFAGWYLPFEMDNAGFNKRVHWKRMGRFYARVIHHLHRLRPGLPVAIAPYYNAHLAGAQRPARWRKMWRSILTRAPIDVIALQDGVGAGHARPSQLAAWFRATRRAIEASRPRTRLIADTETFRFGVSGLEPMGVAQYVADMSQVQGYVDGFWSFAYDHYQSPLAGFSPFYDKTYRAYLGNGVVEASPPGAPSGVSATGVDASHVQLTWGSASDNLGVAGYRIYRNGAWVAVTHGGRTSFLDGPLASGTTYRYAVQAFDGAGNLSPLTPLSYVTTP
ncbi:MAG: DUF4434 domain-containing protein [Nocardioides sp.]